jgi:hypothetical protein
VPGTKPLGQFFSSCCPTASPFALRDLPFPSLEGGSSLDSFGDSIRAPDRETVGWDKEAIRCVIRETESTARTESSDMFLVCHIPWFAWGLVKKSRLRQPFLVANAGLRVQGELLRMLHLRICKGWEFLVSRLQLAVFNH